VTTLSGKDVSLEGLKGKVVVLDFWATWCKPCRMTLPMVQKLTGAMEGRPVEVLCMNVWERDKERKQVVPYWESSRFTMEVGLGSPSDASNYGVQGIPALFVIDQQGQIRYQHRGYSSHMDREITWVIEKLLGEADQGANIGSAKP
jgi:thiol-disulfide isomerase/thioredoxin